MKLMAAQVSKFFTLFVNRPTLKVVATNFSWMAVDKVTRMIVALFVGVWVARYLGPERYGLLAYALALVTMFQTLSLLGLDNIVIREISSSSSEEHRILGTALRLRLIGAMIAYIGLCISVGILHFSEPEVAVIILLAGLSVLFQVTDVIDLWFQSQLQSKRTVIAKMLSYLTAAAVKISLILLGAGITWFALSATLEAVLAALSLCVSYRMFRTRGTWRWDSDLARSLLVKSWPLLVSALSVFVYMRLSVMVLREHRGNAEVGFYSVGTSLSEMWYFLPMAIFSSIAPIVARKRVQHRESYTRLMSKIFSIMWGMSIFVVAINILGARLLVDFLYGDSFAKSADIYAIHSLTFIPVCVGVVQSIWLINEDRSKIALLQSIAGATTALVLNFLLTPKYGAIGAAVSTVASQFVQAFLINAWLAPDLFRLQCQSLRFVNVLRN